MKKPNMRMLSVFLVLVLVLSVLPMAAYAEDHIHNYNVTTTITYEWQSDSKHTKVETHKHLCDCGEIFYENHREEESHLARPESEVMVGSYISSDGTSYTTYSYVCKLCKHTFYRNVAH